MVYFINNGSNKKCKQYKNFYKISFDTIYFHPNFSADLDKTIDFELSVDNKTLLELISIRCKTIKFLDKVEQIDSNDPNSKSFELTKSHCCYCNSYHKSIFNQSINLIQCLELKSIYFGHSFNQPVSKDNLPMIEILVLGNDFNYSIDNIPKTIKILELGNNFNQPINCLPFNLEKLKFGDNFNQKLNCLPDGLKYIELGNFYNHPIKNFPTGLEEFVQGDNFSQLINNLPKDLRKIKFGKRFKKDIKTLPNKIEEIIFQTSR
jgi:hypothetical protein